MMKLLMERGGRIDAVFLLPARAHRAVRMPQARRPASWREVGERYGVDLANVPMLCDTLRDLVAAQKRGLPAAPRAHRSRRRSRRRHAGRLAPPGALDDRARETCAPSRTR